MNPKNSAENAFYAGIVANPWKVLGLCLLLMAFVGNYMQYVTPSISYKDLLGADYPLLKDYEKIQEEYTNDDNLLVLIEAKKGNAFSKEILSAVRELTRELWQTPYSLRVDAITNFQHTEAEGDALLVGDLVGEGESLTPAELAKIKRIALSEPLLLNRAVNQKGNVLAISVSFAFPNLSMDEKPRADGFVQDLAEQFRQRHPDTNVYVSGLVALDATVMALSMQESGLFIGLVMLIVVGLLVCILRSFKPIFVSVFVFVFSIIAGMAFSGMMGWKLTPFTSSVPMIILILAVADCVHFVTSFVYQLRQGEEKKEALVSALRLNFKPIAITSITTAIGFLTLNLSQSEGIRALGNQVAFGVVFAFVLSVSFLPAVLALLSFKSGDGAKAKDSSGRFSDAADLLYKHRSTILPVSVLVSLVLGYFLTLNEFNDNIPTYFAKSLPWRQANDFAEEQFGGANTFSYSLNSGRADGISDPEFLEQTEKFVKWLRSLPEAVYVNSVTDTFKRLNRSMNGDDPSYYRLPEDRQLAAQYLLLYEMSLPYGIDLNDQINLDKSATKVLVTFKTLSTSQILAMEQRIDAWIENNLAGVTANGSGVQIMFAHLLNQDTKGLILGAGYGLLVISFLLVFALRSLRIGLISILPNVLPVAMAFGIWGLFVGEVGMGLAMVSGMTIGIVVDDTVHFLSKYLKGRRDEGLAPRDAVGYAFGNVGPSIVFTTVVLVAGFMVMAALSEFRVNSDMGKMTSIILTIALVFDLVTLPILLMVFDRAKARKLETVQAA